jgi:hypothetical protein
VVGAVDRHAGVGAIAGRFNGAKLVCAVDEHAAVGEAAGRFDALELAGSGREKNSRSLF